MHDSEEPQGPQERKSKSPLVSAHELECIFGQPFASGSSAKLWLPILHSSACRGATVLSRLVRSMAANDHRSVRPCRVGSACSQHPPLLMFFLALVHRFLPLVDSCFIPCSGSHVHLTAGPLAVSSYKLVMLRNLSGYLHVWRRILRTKKNSILLCSFLITLKNSYSKLPHSRRQTASDVSRVTPITLLQPFRRSRGVISKPSRLLS